MNKPRDIFAEAERAAQCGRAVTLEEIAAFANKDCKLGCQGRGVLAPGDAFLAKQEGRTMVWLASPGWHACRCSHDRFLNAKRRFVQMVPVSGGTGFDVFWLKEWEPSRPSTEQAA
jgi:hypothetical protein